LYVCEAEGPEISFRLETNDDIVTSPAEFPPYLYIASMDGYLYCMNEHTGRESWRFSTGYAIISSPAIVGNQAYVASQQPALHAIDAATGKERWHVRGASHFAAQGKNHVYASDRSGNLLAIDLEDGALTGKIRVAEGTFTLVNDQTDRIYLANDEGLIQCLHEIGATEPIAHRPSATEEASMDSSDDESIVSEGGATPLDSETASDAQEPPREADVPIETTPPAVESNPFGDPVGAEGDENPFGPFGE
jgi:hypothetical protein